MKSIQSEATEAKIKWHIRVKIFRGKLEVYKFSVFKLGHEALLWLPGNNELHLTSGGVLEVICKVSKTTQSAKSEDFKKEEMHKKFEH